MISNVMMMIFCSNQPADNSLIFTSHYHLFFIQPAKKDLYRNGVGGMRPLHVKAGSIDGALNVIYHLLVWFGPP